MPRAVVFSVVLSAVLAAHVAAQRPPGFPPAPTNPKTPPAEERIRDMEYVVTVEGCLRDKRFVPVPGDRGGTDLTLRLLDAREFTLEGPKELISRLLQDHNDHQDQITGVAIVPPRERDGDVTVWEVDEKTRVHAGARSKADTPANSPPEPERPRVLRLRVKSLTHIDDKCWAGR